MGDELRDRIARALAAYYGVPHRVDWYYGPADAVLAVLPQYDQVGWQSGSGLFYTDDDRRRNPHVSVVPVCIVRDTTEGETP
jgi:hypothetical protein